jgi:diaminopimelate decarboxylase
MSHVFARVAEFTAIRVQFQAAAMTDQTTSNILHYSTAHELAVKHSTPCYVYSKRLLTKQANEVISFKSPFGLTVRFAMKANPHIEILRLFNALGLWIDASSEYEAQVALAAGFPAHKIVLNSQQLPKVCLLISFSL